jgi:hypothetical protein
MRRLARLLRGRARCPLLLCSLTSDSILSLCRSCSRSPRAKVFWGVVAASTLMVLEMCALRENIDRRGRLQKTTGCVHLARGPDRLSFGSRPTL